MDVTVIGLLIGAYFILAGVPLLRHIESLPDPNPPRLNLDTHGMPRDYTTYEWLLYRRHVPDESPGRIAFLSSTTSGFTDAIGLVLNRKMLDAYKDDVWTSPDLGTTKAR